jgi:hypothetical protein
MVKSINQGFKKFLGHELKGSLCLKCIQTDKGIGSGKQDARLHEQDTDLKEVSD